MAQLASTTIYGDLLVTGRLTGSLQIGTNSSDDEIITVRSQNFAGLELLGDTADTPGEPGGAYVFLSQDGASSNPVTSIIGLVNIAGHDGSGNSYSGTTSNSFLLGHHREYNLHLGTARTVRMTITGSGNVGIGTTSPSYPLHVSGDVGWTGEIKTGGVPAARVTGTLDAARIPNLNASKITAGTLAVARGGTGIGSYTSGNYIRASGSTTLEQRTPAQVRSDIGAAASSTTISAGTGLTGGGSLASNRTISVDSTVVRTTGNQAISGTKTFSASAVFNAGITATTVTSSEYIQLPVRSSNPSNPPNGAIWMVT